MSFIIEGGNRLHVTGHETGVGTVVEKLAAKEAADQNHNQSMIGYPKILLTKCLVRVIPLA